MPQSPNASLFIRSSYICRIKLDETYSGLCHIMGRSRFLCHNSIVALLDKFQSPQDIQVYAENKQLRSATEMLVNSHLLHPVNYLEMDVIRAFYKTKFPLAMPGIHHGERQTRISNTNIQSNDNAIVSGVLQHRFDLSRPHFTAKHTSTLILTKGMTSLSLPEKEILATTFSGRRLHLSTQIWDIALHFKKTTSISKVIETSSDELSSKQVLHICQFLLDQGILWPTLEAEQNYHLALVDQVIDRNISYIPIESGCEQWEQKSLPYDVRTLDIPIHARVTVAAIGFCQVHAYTPTLQYLAQLDGMRLSVCSLMTPSLLSGDNRDWSLILFSKSSAAAALYEAFSLDDRRKCEHLARAIVPEFDREISIIRSFTDAPILVHSLGKPGLTSDTPTSSASHYINDVLCRLNQSLHECLQLHKNAWLLDEDRVASSHTGGIFWDDEYNGLPHHSCVSMWGRPPRSVVTSATPAIVGEDIPPVGEMQTDPAFCFAHAYLQFIQQISVKTPIRMIAFEPNELLWQGRLEQMSAPHPPGSNFFTGDYYSLYIGINEALITLRQQGLLLVCNSTCPTEILNQRWRIESSYGPLVRLPDLHDLYGGTNRAEHLQITMQKAGISEDEVLYIDLCGDTLSPSNSTTYKSDKWGLRRYLLTAPQLHPLLDTEKTSAEYLKIPDAPSTTQNPTPALPPEISEAKAWSTVTGLIIKRLRCTQQDFQKTDDLRLLGLDSLGALELVMQIETALQIKFNDSEYLADTVFFATGIQRATNSAIRRVASIEAQTKQEYEPNTDSLLGHLSYEQWCEQDLVAILNRHISSPTLPWVLKSICSPEKFDYEYLGWHALHAQAQGYMNLYQSNSLLPGDVVTILLPQGGSIVAAWLGAILGRYIPSISAYPSEKLSVDAFLSWFGKIIKSSESRLVICSPDLRELVQECLLKNKLDALCIDTLPPPIYGCEPQTGEIQPDQPALLQHSSGTTGLKKAVLLSHRAILAQIWDLAHALKVKPDDTIVSWLPLYHDMGLIASLVFPLICSIRVVLISPFHWARQPAVLLEQITEESGSLCWMPNFAYSHCAKRIPNQRLIDFDLSSLRELISCSEPVTTNAQQIFAEKFSQCGFRVSSLSSSYAMAETTFAVSQSTTGRFSKWLRIDRQAFQRDHICKPLADNSTADAMQLISSGSILPHSEVKIINNEGNAISNGQIGEICIRSDYLMHAYCNDPKTTDEALQEGWYHSGDLGAIFENELYITGRKKDLIIVAGQNIYPHDVEQMVNEVKGIRPGRVVAFGVFNLEKGTETLIVLAEPASPTPDDTLKASMCRNIHESVLSGLGVSITDVQIYPMQTLHKSTSGKLSRHRNRTMYLTDIGGTPN